MMNVIPVVAMGCFAVSAASSQWSFYCLVLTPLQRYGEGKQTDNIVHIRPPGGCQNGGNSNNDGEKMMNHGMLADKHPGVPHGPDTIMGKGECLQISASFVAFIQSPYLFLRRHGTKFHCFGGFVVFDKTISGKVHPYQNHAPPTCSHVPSFP